MNKKPKLLFVFHSAELNNGGTHSLIEIVDYLIDKRSYNIAAIFPNAGTAADHLRQKGIMDIQYYKYGGLMQDLNQPIIRRIVKLPLLIFRHLNVIYNAYKAFRHNADNGIDLVYNNTSSIVFGGYLGTFLKCKIAWHVREYRIKDHRICFYLGDQFLKKFISRNSDCLFFVSTGTMNEVTDIIDSKKCFVTYNSYPKSFIKTKPCIRKEGTFHILIAGDVKPSKGQFDCVKALEIVKKKHCVKLYIAGRESNRNYCNEIKQYIIDHNLDNDVQLLGQVKDMLSLREKMDIGIVASECEAFGRTTIEGMLCQLAMIGRNSGGTPEQITDGVNGLLYDGTVEDLASKISALIEDHTLMEKVALFGYNQAIAKYTNDNAAKIVEQTLNNLLMIE